MKKVIINGNTYYTNIQTRTQEGASFEDIEAGDAYETAYLVYDDEGNNIWDTTNYEMVREYFEPTKTLEDEIAELHLRTAYELYKLHWCKLRGWDINEVQAAYDCDEEYNGQMFVCCDEFEEYEYHDKEYMKYLFESFLEEEN